MACNLAALWPAKTHSTFFKHLDPSVNIVFALSKRPHLHRAYLLDLKEISPQLRLFTFFQYYSNTWIFHWNKAAIDGIWNFMVARNIWRFYIFPTNVWKYTRKYKKIIMHFLYSYDTLYHSRGWKKLFRLAIFAKVVDTFLRA